MSELSADGIGLPAANFAYMMRGLILQAVEMFLDEKIGYMDIVKTVEKCCDAHVQELLLKPSLDEIVHFDQWARDWVSGNVKTAKSREAVAA